MHAIDRILSTNKPLICDFLKGNFRGRHLDVFLCGRQPDNRHFDLRAQVKRLLETEMGCKAFLGEDIEDLKVERLTVDNHLTIEVREAKRSDLIVMFLGSPGTLAELTAFALDDGIRPKLIIFNDEKYRDTKSFINLGPLKLLNDDQVVYYGAASERPSKELVTHLDIMVARLWYDRCGISSLLNMDISFEAFALLSIISAAFPITYQELLALFPWGETSLRGQLRHVVERQLVITVDKQYHPTRMMSDVTADPGLTRSNAKVRLRMMDRRLRQRRTVVASA